MVGGGRGLREQIAAPRGGNQSVLEVGVCQKERGHVRVRPAIYRLREVALRFQRREGGNLAGRRVGALPLPFVGKEEEQLVAAIDQVRQHDRPAHRNAVLIALQNLARQRLRVIEECVGVEIFVAKIVDRKSTRLNSSHL